MAQVRLQKVLAHLGVASRRHCEDLIRAGRVQVNDQVVGLGSLADPEVDEIRLDGRPVSHSPSRQAQVGQDQSGQDQSGQDQLEKAPQRCTLLLHKPTGVLSTCDDPQGRKTVLDLVPEPWQSIRLYPVGRLDANSSGALLLSNDGDLTLRLTHPRYHIPKTYWVEVAGSPSRHTLDQWRQGIELDGILTRPAQVDPMPVPPPFHRISPPSGTSRQPKPSSTWLQVVLREGRNRQIRNVARQLCHPVLTLHRIAIGSLRLDDLELGQSRLLTPSDLETLHSESHAPYDS
ncbi:MAG: pseudouridine synthase [Cyanophyceae cyanobacterium]